jgi:hypothetical protein
MNKKLAGVTLTAFLKIEEKSITDDKIAALPSLFRHLGLHPLQLVRDK